MAYSGKSTSQIIQGYAKAKGVTQKAVKIDMQVLQRQNMTQESYSYWSGRGDRIISNEYLIKTLMFLFTEHNDWIHGFPKITTYSSSEIDTDKYVALVKNCIKINATLCEHGITINYDDENIPSYTNDQRRNAKLALKNFKFNFGRYDTERRLSIYNLLYVIDNPLMMPLLTCDDQDILLKILSAKTGDILETDPKRMLRVLDNFFALFPDKVKSFDNISGCICCNIFYATGEWFFDKYKVKNSYFLPLVQGTRLAYQRQIEDALKALQLAIKIHNRNVDADEKGFFGGYISNFLLIVILAMDGSEKSRKKIMQILKKKEFTRLAANSAAELLADYFKDDEQEIRPYLLQDCLLKGKYPDDFQGPVQFAYLVARYLSIEPGKIHSSITDADFEPSLYLPKLAIIRHELAPYLGLSSEERQHLTELYGGEPLLTSMRIKQQWELVLESLFEGEADADVKDNNVNARGIYVMTKYSEFIEVKEQKRLKNGTWGKGKKLSMSGYQNGEFEMDELDKSIHVISKNSYYFPTLQSVIPLLVGTTDRLYYESYIDMYPVKVVEEKPFITIDKNKSGITIRTNVPKDKLDNNVVYDFNEASMTLTYYPMDPKEQKYLEQLTTLSIIPLEAEPLLQKVLPSISKKVEIHTDFIEGAENLKEETGNSVLCLRITKQSQSFVAAILVMPLQGGKVYCTPGEGDKIIFDERDGERFKVKRKMRAEKSNKENILEVLESVEAYELNGLYMMSAEDVIAVMEYVHENPDVAYIEWPEGESMRLAIAQPGSWNVSLKKKTGWFDIEGDVQIDDDTVMNIAELLDMVSESRSRFVRLADNQYLAMTDSLRKQLQRIAALASSSRGKTKIPTVGAALLGDALSGELDVKHPKAIDDLRKKIRQSAKLQPAVPDTLNATLRDYQLDGYQWMTRLDSWEAGACLADDMGLGKTIQAITFMLSKKDDGALLIVAPASVVPNWRNELNRFAPSLNVVILNNEADRTAAIAEAEEGTVILTTYGLLNTQEEQLVEKQWGCICLDEAHTIKNRDTKTSAVCMKLQSQHRIILTGTPLQNHLGELWNLFQFINPGLLGSYETFHKKFITPIEAGDNEERRQLLRRIIQPFMLRRTKQEVATELPDKEDIKMYVELSEDEMGVYEVIRRRAKDELEQLEQTGQKVNMNTLAEITRLRMAACASELAEKSWKGECSKLNAFIELIQDLNQNNHRALVFSQFTSFLGMAAKRLDDAGIPYFYLDGSTPMAKREKMVKEFQKGKNNVFLISLKAGGLGLNLTGANYVIHLDPWWNPAIEQQATDRAHRIGQKDKVTVYHLVSENTIEEKILRLHEQKRDLADSLLDGTNNSHKITASQLLEMLTPQ